MGEGVVGKASTEGVNKRRGGRKERAGEGNEKKRYISK